MHHQVFVPLLKKYLLDNTHRVTVEVRPDPELGMSSATCSSKKWADKSGILCHAALDPPVMQTSVIIYRQPPKWKVRKKQKNWQGTRGRYEWHAVTLWLRQKYHHAVQAPLSML